MTPHATERASFEEYRRSNALSVVYGKLFDIKYETFHVPPLNNNQNLLATFLLTPQAQKKSSQKKTPLGNVSPVATGDQGSAFGIRNLLKKVDQNFHRRVVRTDHTEYSCLAMTWS